jgi:S-adenosylmethionine synthetase
VAKNAVAAGLAERLEVQIAYAIGRAKPVGLYVETFGTGAVADEVITRAILDVFDLRPKAIIDQLDLLRPIYAQTAAYGHFGRELPDFTWERTDRVDQLRAAAGLAASDAEAGVGAGVTTPG